MNTVGRAFVIIILVMSLVFMGLMFSVYATHKNWKKQAEAKTAELDKIKTELNATKAKLDEQIVAFNALKLQKDDAISQLQANMATLSNSNATLKETNDKLEGERTQMLANVASIHQNYANIQKQNTQFKVAFLQSKKEFAENLQDLVEETKKAQTLAVDLKNYKATGAQLTTQYQGALDVLRKLGAKSPDPAAYADVPPKVEGVVTEVRVNNGTNNSMVEISIGEDDGLNKGHQLFVYRNDDGRSTLIGKIEVVELEPNKAACRVLPDYRTGNIQRDDNVATKLE